MQRFDKNKKLKAIFIGSAVGILLIIGGISLYRTFALYKEEKTFNVLQGTVPDFRNCRTLGGATPVIKEGLVPVTIGNDGSVTKISKNSKDWYNYCDKKWANAVILTSEGQTKTYKDGDKISENDIESYFVWIPKYSYKLFDMGTYTSITTLTPNKAKSIEIKFGLDNTIDDEKSNLEYKQCETPMTSGSSGQCHIDDWMTHPAFISFDVNGIWVGKFETGYKGATATTFPINQSNVSNTNIYNTSKIVIKPDQYSWRFINLYNAYLNSFNYQRNLDSHLIKNTEWGAMAILSHSEYGTCTNNSCEEVRINNNVGDDDNGFVTGFAAKNIPTKGWDRVSSNGNLYIKSAPGTDSVYSYHYWNPLSVVASTTGNYSGIYDTSGDCQEFTSSFMLDATGNILYGSSGFSNTNFPTNKKYYDVYNYGTSDKDFSRRILGDATGEIGPFQIFTWVNARPMSSWHNDEGWAINNAAPNISRGLYARNGLGGGIFAFMADEASLSYTLGFRVVLAPQE